ncbi:phosphodiesterase [Shewanella sp. NIFS-20-20]|uniref:phosphodiesterase n=1 Tax=Shewanella sp. NIFS-20-20 TaxID=2853806 RepID=UPI001C45DAB4|nr:phosphodiesterase [Shewanella sp. NIFS-20-20]MBV7316017.1 phosphodiesterase [Shewanella sp. NIFS-20-20]
MTLFIASDLHGSLTAGQAMLARFEQSGARYLLLLGDLLNHGPRNAIPAGYDPVSLAEHLNQYADRIIAVRGNCDSEVDQMLLKFPFTASYQQVLLPQMRLFLTHGHIYHPDNLPPLQTGDGFVYGHTHIPLAEYQEGVLHFNPGSTTIPRNGGRASYGLLSDTECQVRDLHTDEVIVSCKLRHAL